MNKERAGVGSTGPVTDRAPNDQKNTKGSSRQQRPPRPPKPDVPCFENMPQALTARAQWVLWRWEWSIKSNDWAKVPYQVSGKRARSTDASTWSTFEAVVSAYRRGRYDGVGFMLSADDPFVFIDLDHVLHDGVLEDWAQDLIDRAASYTEWSVRGEGIHILVEGVLPDGKGRHGDRLEVYDRARFVIMTGRVATVTPLPIEKRAGFVREVLAHPRLPQAALPGGTQAAEVPGKTPDQILEGISGSNQRELFFLLHESYAGGAPETLPRHGGKDQSDSGYDSYYVAVCRKNGATVQQALDLWKSSALASRLSEAERDRLGVYLDTNVLAKDKAKSTRPPLVSVLGSDVVEEELRWMVSGYFAYGVLHLVAGDPDVGKSLFLIDLIAKHTTKGGHYLFPRDGGVGGPLKFPVQYGRALLVTDEDNYRNVIYPRCVAAGADMERVRFLNDSTGPALAFPEDVSALTEHVKQHEIDLVIIEPLDSFITDGEHRAHNNAAMRKGVLRPLRQMAEATGACVIYLQHLNKMSTEKSALYRSSGSVANVAAARGSYHIGFHPEDSDKPKQERRRVLAKGKNNLARDDGRAWVFKIEEVEVDDLINADQPKIKWLGTTSMTADDLLIRKGERKKVEARDEAKDFIMAKLKDGPVPAHELLQQAAGERQITQRTLERARQDLEKEKLIKYVAVSKTWMRAKEEF